MAKKRAKRAAKAKAKAAPAVVSTSAATPGRANAPAGASSSSTGAPGGASAPAGASGRANAPAGASSSAAAPGPANGPGDASSSAAAPGRANLIPAVALRNARAVPFGQEFVLAEVYAQGTLSAWSCRCFLHTADERGCNKTLVMGRTFTPEEAQRRIMRWCLEGRQYPNTEGGRDLHMAINPRFYDEVSPLEELHRRASL